MQRKTAVAAAGAISMSLASAAIAIGASFGALGFGASSSATAAQASAVPSSATTNLTASTRAQGSEHERESRTTGAIVATGRATQEKGHGSDD